MKKLRNRLGKGKIDINFNKMCKLDLRIQMKIWYRVTMGEIIKLIHILGSIKTK